MKMTQKDAEFDPHPVAPERMLEGPLAALLEWQAMAEGAYSANTLRAQKADGAIFQAFCESRRESYLPADPKTIRKRVFSSRGCAETSTDGRPSTTWADAPNQ